MKNCLILLFVVLIFTACEEPRDKRIYTETVPEDTPQQTMQAGVPRGAMDLERIADVPVPQTPLSWETPEGWAEERGSGIRIVTFRTEGSDPVEVSIVSLSGPAGGLVPNAVRWAGQIGVPADNIEAFIDRQEEITTQNGLSGRIIDFTGLQPEAGGAAPSIIGAVFPLGDDSLFVKMTGSKAAVTAEKSEFRQLLQSLRTP